MRIPRLPKIVLRPLILGGVLGALGAVAANSDPGRAYEEFVALPWLFRLRGPVAPPSSVLIASIDAQSARELGHKDEPWKWPRSRHSELVDRLVALDARLVVFDLHFEESRSEHDTTLASSMRRAGNVVLVEELRYERREIDSGTSIVIHQRTPPTAVLAEAAAGSAPFPLPKVPDRVTRVWLELPGDNRPTLPLLALQVAAQRGDSSAASALRTTSARAGQLQLAFYGPPGTVPRRSYADLLRQDTASLRPLVQGRAVFVGASERLPLLTPDEFRTPFSRAGTHLSGVEILATTYANLLAGHSVRQVDSAVITACLMLFGLVLGFVFMHLPALLMLPSALLLALAWSGLAVAVFERSTVWLPFAIPLSLQIAPGLIAALLWRFALARGEREQLQQAFGRYLPARVVRKLAGGQFQPQQRWDLVQGVCLFTDAEQYTSLSEGMSPVDLRELLNDYYSVIFEPVQRHGGFVSDVVGDAMLALWATRRPNGGPRRSACEAALQMLEGVASFNAQRPQTSLPTRIGIHCGRVVLGDVGAGDHYEYRAVGDIVNTASRLEGLNKRLGTRVLVTDDVIHGLDGFVSREVGKFQFKGKTEPLRVHELMGLTHLANAALLERISDFETALETFRVRRWAVARNLFRRLSESNASDGVASYYISLCERFIAEPPGAEWQGDIALTEK